MERTQLHGTLEVTIYEVNKTHVGRTLFSKVKESVVPSKYSASIRLDYEKMGSTRWEKSDHHDNVIWNMHFRIYCAHIVSNIVFSVAKRESPNSPIGEARVPVSKVLDGQEIDEWFEMSDYMIVRDPKPVGFKIHVKLKYVGAMNNDNWGKGIGDSEFAGVPFTSFPQRKKCKVTLYQDAHVPDNYIFPKISLAGDKTYEARQKCWEDIFEAMNNAKCFIYITGWSINNKITLVRDPRRPISGKVTELGELLKKKAEEGVEVLMLVWEDRTDCSNSIGYGGMMHAHGQETKRYFEGSRVNCVLCPRQPHYEGSFLRKVESYFIFSHHQKTVVVDSEIMPGDSSDQKRRIVSFVGGFDLCDGRYDTPSHSLFRTLETDHLDDFHQPSIPGAKLEKGGPREPWHDIHAKLEGVIAWDVLCNFQQRWRKQGGKEKDILFVSDDRDLIIPPSPPPADDDHETWNAQLFRSTDSNASTWSPITPESLDVQASSSRGGPANSVMIDRGIQDAYIEAIRRAKEFIYIESQYFFGSSFAWSSQDDNPEYRNNNDRGCLNLIPKEISFKIVSMIKAKKRFVVYVVVPMWPEGEPETTTVQQMLSNQKRTMEMMYEDIIQALVAKGIEEDPRNYLAFFCLGNREVKKPGENDVPEKLKPEPDSNYRRAQEARRFMIYVHSKMMIVDDKYIIVGSANINQRSMDGARDTEIAMGGYQPRHLGTENQRARGQIHGFRMALWHEHLGMHNNNNHLFLNPGTRECIQEVNRIADYHWGLYSRDEALDDDLPGHLLRYPIQIDSLREVAELTGFQFFPDTKAPVLGENSNLVFYDKAC